MKVKFVTNSEGKKELFSERKIYLSLRRAGIEKAIAKKITKQVKSEIYNGIRTFEISRKIKDILYQEFPKQAIKYDIKSGMLKLGPAGFLFEKYIAKLFSFLGYKTKLNLRLKGKSGAVYEIDIFLEKKDFQLLVECKYKNFPGERVDLPIVLENFSRFLDIKNSNRFFKKRINTLIVTNSKFTSQAIKFAKFYKNLLLGWKYPKNQGLEKIIEKYNLYPITILPSFSQNYKDYFVKEDIILVKEILSYNLESFSKKYKIPIKFLEELKSESEILLR